MKRSDQELRVLVVGSGPIVIGQAAEFDYSGTQACKVLRSMGAYTVLLNSNPATIQTDPETAHRVYIRTVNWKSAEEIIIREKINALVGCMAGQTGLNTLLDLHDRGILSKYSVEVLGTDPESIRRAEDRILFHRIMRENGMKVPESMSIDADTWKEKIDQIDFYPFMARTSFTLGGKSGAIVRNRAEAESLFRHAFADGKHGEIEIEHALGGMVEMEYEVIRDSLGNSIMICNMENLDPMGVHTGESIVVTPSLTINDRLHQKMREMAIKIAGILNIKGACNVQFAIDQENQEVYIVEVNPRTSRSSALASKATGYPIAKIATEIITGRKLTEIMNPITGNTSASFEPSQDYVVVKIPLWPEKQFPGENSIGVSMKSTGETMGIGRAFEEAFFKALVSTEIDLSRYFRVKIDGQYLREHIRKPTRERVGCIINAILQGVSIRELSEMSGWDSRILARIHEPLSALFQLNRDEVWEMLPDLKRWGIPDRIISWATGITELELLSKRREMNIIPSYRIIDSSSGEYRSGTGYLYSTYFEEDESGGPLEKSVIIMGSGPNRIAQGLEFDYSAVKAVRHLGKTGWNSLMINSNPETVSTDFDESGQLYFEPLVPEYVSGLIDRKNPLGVILQFSGQTGQNMAMILSKVHGDEIILGTSCNSIMNIEERGIFSGFLQKNGILQPEWRTAGDVEEIMKSVGMLHFPVIVRSSYIIGGSLMRILRKEKDLELYLEEYRKIPDGMEVHISSYLEGAREFDLDFICNGEEIVTIGIMEHLEPAGVHSGDAISIGGPGIPDKKLRDNAIHIASLLSREFSLKGFANLQFMEKNGDIYIIELNSRASRTIPIMAKHSGQHWVETGTSVIMGAKLAQIKNEDKDYFAKIPVFPFDRYPDSEIELGPEMKSTGEAMVSGTTLEELKRNMIQELSMTRRILLFEENQSRIHSHGKSRVIPEKEAIKMLDTHEGLTVYCPSVEKSREIRRKCVERDIPLIMEKKVLTFLYPDIEEIVLN